jgi:hypothetical protein
MESNQSLRLPASLEKPFRKALGHAIRNEIDEMKASLDGLSDTEFVACLVLCAFTSAYVAVDVCGRQWPIEDNLQEIAEATTESNNAKRFGLKAEDSYKYVKRVALGFEPLDAVFPSVQDAFTLSFFITGQLLLSFHPADVEWWHYLNRIEQVFEISEESDLDVLPGLMIRSRRLGSPRTFGEIPR